MQRFFIIIILAFLSIPAIAETKENKDQTAAANNDPIVGTWIGIVYQHNTQPYPAIMSFNSTQSGTSEYASYPCTGALTRTDDETKYAFVENITYTEKSPDDGGCINGVITMEVYGDEMDWTWTGAPPDETLIAIGSFYRQKDLHIDGLKK